MLLKLDYFFTIFSSLLFSHFNPLPSPLSLACALSPFAGFALSLVYGDDVKHIKIQVSNTEGLYFLADVKFFASIPKLVDHYSRISLVGSFPGLDTVLKYPYHQM